MVLLPPSTFELPSAAFAEALPRALLLAAAAAAREAAGGAAMDVEGPAGGVRAAPTLAASALERKRVLGRRIRGIGRVEGSAFRPVLRSAVDPDDAAAAAAVPTAPQLHGTPGQSQLPQATQVQAPLRVLPMTPADRAATAAALSISPEQLTQHLHQQALLQQQHQQQQLAAPAAPASPAAAHSAAAAPAPASAGPLTAAALASQPAAPAAGAGAFPFAYRAALTPGAAGAGGAGLLGSSSSLHGRSASRLFGGQQLQAQQQAQQSGYLHGSQLLQSQAHAAAAPFPAAALHFTGGASALGASAAGGG